MGSHVPWIVSVSALLLFVSFAYYREQRKARMKVTTSNRESTLDPTNPPATGNNPTQTAFLFEETQHDPLQTQPNSAFHTVDNHMVTTEEHPLHPDHHKNSRNFASVEGGKVIKSARFCDDRSEVLYEWLDMHTWQECVDNLPKDGQVYGMTYDSISKKCIVYSKGTLIAAQTNFTTWVSPGKSMA
jgi:hypothetical protein